jgi:hypothetical protein
VANVHDGARTEEHPRRYLVGGIYIALIAANLYLVFDWWADTEQGQSVIAAWRARLDAVRAKAAECQGCARRKAKMRSAMNRMHWQARQILEGEDVETQPEQP